MTIHPGGLRTAQATECDNASCRSVHATERVCARVCVCVRELLVQVSGPQSAI